MASSVFSQVLFTTAEPADKFLWLTSDQVIVPEETATPHLGFLAELNTRYNGAGPEPPAILQESYPDQLWQDRIGIFQRLPARVTIGGMKIFPSRR